MRKFIYLGGSVAILITLAGVLAPRAEAQQGRPTAGAMFLTLEGLGSSIGVSVRDTDADEARKSGSAGVVVQDVREGTAAARAGLREADVVVEFDGERVRSARQFTRLVRETAPGRLVKMTVMRGGSRETLDITPEARGQVDLDFPNITSNIQPGRPGLRVLPRDFAFDFNFAEPGFGPFSQQRLGVTVTALTPQLATYFGVKQGALVSEVVPNSPAEAAGVKAGDVITTINGRDVSGADDVAREVRAAEAGTSVEVRVMRDRRELTLSARLPERRRPTVGGGRPI